MTTTTSSSGGAGARRTSSSTITSLCLLGSDLARVLLTSMTSLLVRSDLASVRDLRGLLIISTSVAPEGLFALKTVYKTQSIKAMPSTTPSTIPTTVPGEGLLAGGV